MNRFLHTLIRDLGFSASGLGAVEGYFFFAAGHWGNLAYAMVGILLCHWLVCRMQTRLCYDGRASREQKPPTSGSPWGDTNKNGPAPEVRAVVLNDSNRDEVVSMIRRALR